MAKKIIDTTEKKKPHHHSQLITWVIIIVVVVAAVGALAAVLFLQQQKPQANNQSADVSAGDTVKEALDTGKTPDEATLKAALNKNPSKEEKQQILQLLADDAQRRGDFKAAVSYLEQSHQAGVTVALLVQSIADLYLNQLGDKPHALKNYKEARVLTEQQKNDDPYSSKNLEYIDGKIKELEGQGVTPAQ